MNNFFRTVTAAVSAMTFLSACETRELISGSVEGMKVPEGFVVERAVPEELVKYPMFATLDSAGRLFVAESSGQTTSTEDVLKNPTFMIRLLEDTDSDGVFDKSVVFADKLPYPMGGTFYRGSFYTAVPPDLLKLTDTDGDGIADKRDVILTGWTLSHNAATLSGPFIGPDGWMYMCDARRGFNITTKEGTQLIGKTARIWRCRPDGSGLESVSGGGFDNTIELVFMPGGETIGTMTYFTDPQDGLRDAIMHWVEGGVYPKVFPAIEADKLKLTGALMPVMTKLARVSHAGLMRYRGVSFGVQYESNLFTAEFNTGRIMRHTIATDGGTFKTETEPFMTSDIPDFHPTDVLEDADGSLLFVNTGGWFIAGCPLSVVAKTDVRGGIYRIRKRSGSMTEDPWGKKIDFQKVSAEELVTMTGDPRHVVRDNAFEQLIIRGYSSVHHVSALLESQKDEEIRASAVFALYRIGGSGAMDAVVEALDDESIVVRTAACRAAGLAGERKAVDKLLHILQTDQPRARRQAATALGQIGDEKAIAGLLAANENNTDRFVEHAAIYSLISFDKSEPLVEALKQPSEALSRAALIALDQSNSNSLRKDHLKPFLTSESPELRRTALWVLSHRTDWGDLAVDFINNFFRDPSKDSFDQALVADLMVQFSEYAPLQQLISSTVNSREISVENKVMLLEVMEKSPAEELPRKWVNSLQRLLDEKNPVVLSKAIDVIASRRISSMRDELLELVRNAQYPTGFRLRALGAKIASEPQLSDPEFGLLLDLLGSQHESAIRQSATRLLAEADLTDAQLLTLSRDYVSGADVFLLSGLLSAFEGARDDELGLELVRALSSSPEDHLDHVSLADLVSLIESFSPEVQESAVPLLARLQKRHASRFAELQALEEDLTSGDVGAGRVLFYGKALCSSCHAIAGNGAKFGPDLTNIGEIRSQHDILEAIVYPSASFAREYETASIITKTTAYTGIVKVQMPDHVLVESAPGVQLRIPASDIVRIETQQSSLMPAGLHKQLSLEELSDLMAYLRTLPDGLGHLKHTTAAH
jgi:putative membrane-bound dehydrogenase-like protein